MVPKPIYNAWYKMIYRCYNSKSANFAWYGGRGITVCDAWLKDVNAFYADMGDKPSDNHTLDRINNDGNYELSNCRWATWGEQQRNRSTNATLTWNGVTKCKVDWAASLGISLASLNGRLRHHSIGVALSSRGHSVGIHLRESCKPAALPGKTRRRYCSSRFLGVSWHKGIKRWCAYVKKNQVLVFRQHFGSELEAAIARDDAAVNAFGSRAVLNFPERYKFSPTHPGAF